MSVVEDRKKALKKRLRKRDRKTLKQLADELGQGTTIKHLTLPIAQLVADGEAVKHAGRVPEYTKA